MSIEHRVIVKEKNRWQKRYEVFRYLDNRPIQCIAHLEGDFYFIGFADRDHLVLWEKDPIDPNKGAAP